MENIKTLFCLFSAYALCSGCFSNSKIEKYQVTSECVFEALNPDFDKKLWQADDEGKLGYRLKFFDKDTCSLRLKLGMRKNCITDYLGKPTLDKGEIVEYIIQDENFSLTLYFNKEHYEGSKLILF